jgi:hypothetical protein
MEIGVCCRQVEPVRKYYIVHWNLENKINSESLGRNLKSKNITGIVIFKFGDELMEHVFISVRIYLRTR